MAKTVIRPTILLECTECKNRNYATEKNIKEHKDRLELLKFCKHCRVRRLHKETK